MVDYSASVVFGYLVEDVQAFLRPFTVTKGQESHWEDRYDPMTGAKVDPVEIIDSPGGEVILVCGNEFDIPTEGFINHELADFLSGMLGATVSIVGVFGENALLAIEPDGDDIYVFDDIPRTMEAIRELGDRCRAVGLDPGRPGIYPVLDGC